MGTDLGPILGPMSTTAGVGHHHRMTARPLVPEPERFDHFARDYDRFVALRPHETAWFEALDLRGERALDAGCGSGRQAVALAERFDDVVGVDVSAPLIEIARTRSHPRVAYVVADLCDYADTEGFDLVYSASALHHVADYPAALRHLRSLLRPGGTAVLVDNVSGRGLTPPRWVYLLGAPVTFVGDVRRVGMSDAWWLLRFRTGGPWLAHLVSDRYLSRSRFRTLYDAVFPGVRFVDLGYALAAVWTEPSVPSTT